MDPSKTSQPNSLDGNQAEVLPPTLDAAWTSLLERVEIKAATVQTLQVTRRRRALFFSIVVFLAGLWFLWQIVQPVRNLANSPTSFLDEFQKISSTVFLPLLHQEARRTGPKVFTAVEKAFQTEWTKKSQNFASLMREFDLLLGQLGRDLGQFANSRIDFLLARYEHQLEKDFPAIATDEALLNAVHESLQSALTQVLGVRFRQPFEHLTAMGEAFQGLQVPTQVKKFKDDELHEHLIALINAWLDHRVGSATEGFRVLRETLRNLQDRLLDTVQHLEGKVPAVVNPVEDKEGGQ